MELGTADDLYGTTVVHHTTKTAKIKKGDITCLAQPEIIQYPITFVYMH